MARPLGKYQYQNLPKSSAEDALPEADEAPKAAAQRQDVRADEGAGLPKLPTQPQRVSPRG